MTSRKLDPQTDMPRPPIVLPGAPICTDTIEQPQVVPGIIPASRPTPRIEYPQPRGAVPVGYPTTAQPSRKP
jgi:hypothetical protein